MNKITQSIRWLLAWLVVLIAYVPMRLIWKVTGWRFEGDPRAKVRPFKKLIILGVPHTTNWDYWLMLNTSLYVFRRPYTTVKIELLKPPIGWFIRAAGGIGIDRSKREGVSDQLAQRLREADKMMLVFTPEGTRSYRPYWRTGFYYTAHKAGVPIVCAYADYPRRVLGVGLVLHTTGDIEADFAQIRDFYAEYGRNGLYPDKMNDLALPPADGANGGEVAKR